MKILNFYLGLCLFVLLSWTSESSDIEIAGELSLKELYQAISNEHSLVKSSLLNINAAKTLAKYADTKPNPKLEMAYWLEPIQTKQGPTNKKLSLSQKILPPSKLKLRKRVELGNVEILELENLKIKQDLKYELSKTFFEYHFLFKKLDILKQNLKLVQSWAKLWETHYSHHNFRYPRLVQLQIELTRIQDQIREVNELIPIVYQQLMSSSDLNESTVRIPIHESKLMQYDLSHKADNNIDLLILQSKLQRQTLNKSLERTSFIPNKTIKSEITSIDSPHGADVGNPWMIGLGVDIILNKAQIKSRVASKQAAVKASEIKITYFKSGTEAKLKDVIFRINNNLKRYLILKNELLPRTQESLDSLQVSYSSQTNDMDFFGLLETLRTLLDINLEVESVRKIFFQDLARFQRLSGTPIL